MLDYALGAIIEGSTAVLAASVLLQIDGEAMGSFLDAVSEDWPTFWRPFTLGSCGALLLRVVQASLARGPDAIALHRVALAVAAASTSVLAPAAVSRARALRRALASVSAVSSQGRGASEQLATALCAEAQAREDLEKVQRDLTALRAQASQQAKEYSRVFAENRSLESRLEDYALLWGDQAKKKS